MENTVATNSRKRPSGDSGRCTKQSSKRNYSSKKCKGPPNRYTKLKDGATKQKDLPVSVKKIHTHTHIQTYPHANSHTHTFTHIHTYRHIHVHTHIHTHTQIDKHPRIHPYIHIRINTHTHIHVCAPTRVHTYTRTPIHSMENIIQYRS